MLLMLLLLPFEWAQSSICFGFFCCWLCCFCILPAMNYHSQHTHTHTVTSTHTYIYICIYHKLCYIRWLLLRMPSTRYALRAHVIYWNTFLFAMMWTTTTTTTTTTILCLIVLVVVVVSTNTPTLVSVACVGFSARFIEYLYYNLLAVYATIIMYSVIILCILVIYFN